MLGPTRIAELLASHGVTARRSLGQNFVADPATIERIVRIAGVGPGDSVVEVGPGLGSLTVALVGTGARVLAVEKDPALLGVLAEVLGQAAASGSGGPVAVEPVEVVEADALEVDWGDLLAGAPRWTLVANLPYNVAVPIVMSVLSGAPQVGRLVVMVQREVGERLAAGPGGRTIGVPSITTAWYAHAEVVATVGPEAFVPAPSVTSVVLELVRRPPPRTDVAPEEVFSLVSAAYRQRRKMLRVSLAGRVDAEQFGLAGIEGTRRPEELDVAQWARLASVVTHGERS